MKESSNTPHGGARVRHYLGAHQSSGARDIARQRISDGVQFLLAEDTGPRRQRGPLRASKAPE